MKVVSTLRIGHVYHLTLEPSNGAKTKLAICETFVFEDSDRPIEDPLAAWKVVAVLANVLASLRFVPGWHT